MGAATVLQSRCNRWLTYTVIAAALPMLPLLAEGQNWMPQLILAVVSSWLVARLAGLLPGAYTGYIAYTMLQEHGAPAVPWVLEEAVLPILLIAALHGGRRKPHAVLDTLQYARPRFSPLLVYLTAWQALYTIGIHDTGLPDTIPTGALPALAAGLIARTRLEAIVTGLLPLHPLGGVGVLAAAALRPVTPPSCTGIALRGRLVAIEGRAGSARSASNGRGRSLVCVEPWEPLVEESRGVVLWYYTRLPPESILYGPMIVFDLARGEYSEDSFTRALAEAEREEGTSIVGLGSLPLESRLTLLASLLADPRLRELDAWVVVDARGIEIDKPSQLVPEAPAAHRIAVVLDSPLSEHRLYYAPRGFNYAVAVYDIDTTVLEIFVRRIVPWLRAEDLEGYGFLWPYCSGLTVAYTLPAHNNIKDKKIRRV